jgi:hypothetical protein
MITKRQGLASPRQVKKFGYQATRITFTKKSKSLITERQELASPIQVKKFGYQATRISFT